MSKPTLNPSAVSPADLATLLSAAGRRRITVEMIDEDIGLGAPVNADGTLNLINYAAWMVKVLAENDGGD